MRAGILWQVVLIAQLLTLASAQQHKDAPETETLRYYADKLGIGIGSAIQGRYWDADPQLRKVVGTEFSRAVSITPMKFTEPEPDHFDFASMDRDIAFAKEHQMRLFGTPIIYRNDEAAPWLRFNPFFCGGWSPDALGQVLKKFVQALVRHGGETYFAWELVNEPTAPGNNRCWSRVLGYEEAIATVFRYAREASPNALLLINDTYGHAGVDRDRADNFLSLVKRLKSQGVPIDAVGTEMHLQLQQLHPNYVDEFKYFLEAARKLGVQVHITELDVYQGPPGAFADPWAKQKEVFYNIVHTCVQDTNCSSITIFGTSDKYTWLRNDDELQNPAPLLFDDKYNKKPAYYGVLQALKDGRKPN